MAKANSSVKKTGVRRRERKNIDKGSAHIHSSFNNTIVSITDTKGLPVRGQRTKTNARTRKGPRKLVSKSKK